MYPPPSLSIEKNKLFIASHNLSKCAETFRRPIPSRHVSYYFGGRKLLPRMLEIYLNKNSACVYAFLLLPKANKEKFW